MAKYERKDATGKITQASELLPVFANAIIGEISSKLISDTAKSEEDVVVIASALVNAAEMIYRHVGGARLAAVQFYDVADRCSAE